MTTLTIPLSERQLLATVTEDVLPEPASQWPPQYFRLCLDVVEKLRENAAQMRQTLEEELSKGTEARSFVREYSPLLALSDTLVAKIKKRLSHLEQEGDAASADLAARFRALDGEFQAFRRLLADALTHASQSPRMVDRGRVRAAEEAFAQGETKPFSRR